MRVLLVEDQPQVRATLTDFLIITGHSVMAVGDAASGLKAVESFAYNALISDVCLPDGTCLDLAERAARNSIPVLLFTGDLVFADKLEAAGIQHLTKPFKLQAITMWLDEIQTPHQREPLAEHAKFALLHAQLKRSG